MERFISSVAKVGLCFKALIAISFTLLYVSLFTTYCCKTQCTTNKTIHRIKYVFLTFY